MAYEIEEDVPLPGSGWASGRREALRSLSKSKKGSSVFFCDAKNTVINGAVQAIRRELNLPKGYLTVRKFDGGVRVWKVGE